MKRNIYKIKMFVVSITMFLLLLCVSWILLQKENIIKTVKSNKATKELISINEAIDSNNYLNFNNLQNDILYENELYGSFTFSIQDSYQVKAYINNEEVSVDVKENNFVIPIENEGSNKLKILFMQGNDEVAETSKDFYYIKKYQKQYNQDSTSNGIQLHWNGYEKYDISNNQLQALGTTMARLDFFETQIETSEENYDFSEYDKWMKYFNDNGLKVVGILNRLYSGDDDIVNSDEEIDRICKFAKAVSERYDFVVSFEVMNEINVKYYNTEENIYWYSKLMKRLQETVPDVRVIMSGLSTVDSQSNYKVITGNEFIKIFSKYDGGILNDYNIHIYENNNETRLKERLKDYTNLLNDCGGFIRLNVTEYGSSLQKLTESEQAIDLIKQTLIISKDVKIISLYNLWTATTNTKSFEQFGLLTNDYKPRLSYYAMKNFYQNTNGSEYIGSIPSVADELEFHVYDKDGVPLIICWSSDNSKTIEIPYSGFTACDLYGNEIENTDGKLSITNSPVYLKNADRSYFYRAISNTAVNAYDDFLTNYSDYLDSSDEMISIKNKVNQMKKYAAGLATNGEVTEAEALNKMKEHFAIGNMIIDAYKNGTLSCEYVKLSSMLDQLNTTAYAFEDLLTITAKDVSNAKLEATESIMNSFDNVVSANSEVEMIYPNKIKAFAKDYYDTSSYINGLEEDNPIKNGLIISKGLHAYYLAEWASSFADCYLQDYEVKIKYSTTDLTNEDVVATLETDAPIELEGSNQYTFTENGSFTFKYTLNGEEKEITAVVDWIDKDVPVISGIDEREDDMDQVTLNVTDANLDSISLKKDGQDVSFNNGDVLIEVGEYVVIATDLAGNKAERSFKIVDYIESNKTYYISLNGTGDGLSGENPMNVKDVNKTRFYSGDKILFKSGEKYSIDIDCIRKGSPDNRVVISNYGEGALPVINGSLDLVSNLKISNLRFTNNAESCLVTNYDYCENVKIENCIFDNVTDSAIYLNRQVSNIEITNCIFKNCKSTAIVMKNDNNGFEADKVSINNNVFIDIAKSIEIGSENLDNVFSEIEISKNYFVGQTGSEAIININKIVPDKFEVYIYSNLFYGFDNAYKVITEDENIKKFLVCDYNAFYRYSESNIFNDIKNTADLINRYDNENGSKVVFISKEKYEVEKCLESVSALNSVDEIVEFLSTDVKAHEGEKQLRSYGRTDELIINKVLTADEMKKLNMKVMTDSTVADEKLPLAGWQKVSIAGILIIAVTGLFSAIKYAKFKKDTRKQIRRK